MAIEGPGRSHARRESSRCCPEARRPPHPGSPTPVPQGWRQRAAASRARLSSPSGALRSRRLQPAGSGSTSSTRPSTSDRRGCHVCLHMRIHARCSVFRVAMFRRAFALVVAFYLRRSPTLFFDGVVWVDGFTAVHGLSVLFSYLILSYLIPSSGRRAGTLGSWPNRVRSHRDARKCPTLRFHR